MTLFGLIRHGQTDYNARNLFQGSSDIPLNATGIEQAHHALDHVPDMTWDVIVSSPLQRAEGTARIIAEDHGIPFGGTFADLSEIDWGAAEGQDVAEMERRYPGRSFPGREDHQRVADRGFDSLEQLADRYPGQRVLVVAHGTIIRFILSGVAERALDSIPNATLSLVELEGTTWTVQMIANEPLHHVVRTASRDQNPRFVLEHRNLTPGADPVEGRGQSSPPSEREPQPTPAPPSRASDPESTDPESTEEIR